MFKAFYSWDEILDLLDQAEKQGYDLGPGSPLEDLTINQLATLVNFGAQ